MMISTPFFKKEVLNPDYLFVIIFKYKPNSLAIFPESISKC